MGTPAQKADQLRQIAAEIRANPYARATMPDLFAEAMEPCEDCGHPSLDDLPVIDPQDNPETGV